MLVGDANIVIMILVDNVKAIKKISAHICIDSKCNNYHNNIK
jgi:hypothetical protein